MPAFHLLIEPFSRDHQPSEDVLAFLSVFTYHREIWEFQVLCYSRWTVWPHSPITLGSRNVTVWVVAIVEPLHFSNIDGADDTEGVDLTTISGGIPRIYHHTQIGQCLVDVLHDMMSEGKASLQDKETALRVLEEEFHLAFRSLHPEVQDSQAKGENGRGKGRKKRKRRDKDELEDDGEGLMDQDILSILRGDPLFSKEDGDLEQRGPIIEGVHAQRTQNTRLALDRAATSYGTEAWKFTGRLDEMGGLRECQALQCSNLIRGSKAEMKSPLIQLNFDEIEVRVADDDAVKESAVKRNL
ncbi:hypothetical protein FOZ61_008297 [Perkinsus olseni]|uniref:Uncharacterized protein n=1 Tax=Perkinsus olseni TaxID=32597 RepID=A0A7J6M7A6_PEROL|nr:hypothetical protein FOZ61_008297 [Perkinsus olseni]